jgi:uncharacterized Fe-S cluster protein YjdI
MEQEFFPWCRIIAVDRIPWISYLRKCRLKSEGLAGNMSQEENRMREYRNEDLIVYWFPEICSHSGKCWGPLPEVFKPQQKPWVDMEGASAEEIIQIIDRCPSGALKYGIPAGSRINPESASGPGFIDYHTEAAVKIRVARNGPLLLDGPAVIYSADGTVLKEGAKIVLCRCGLSGNRPFCDGSHARKGWSVD